MGIQSVAILLRVYNCSIFSSHFHGYTQSCMATNAFAGTQTGWWGTNVYLHNTLNIVGHIHLVLLVGSVLLALGLVYSILPSITGRMLGKKLGIVHLFLTIIGE